MKVPVGTKEIQDNVMKGKELLIRLNKGSKMIEEYLGNGEYLEAQKAIRHWAKLSKELFKHMETATLLHQYQLTDNSVLLQANGTLIKVEDLVDPQGIELDPFTLISLDMLKNVFGDDIHNFINIEANPPN